jgi:hypothetical protein
MIIGGITFFLLVSYRPNSHTEVSAHTKTDSSLYYKAKIKSLEKQLKDQQQLLKTALPNTRR